MLSVKQRCSVQIEMPLVNSVGTKCHYNQQVQHWTTAVNDQSDSELIIHRYH